MRGTNKSKLLVLWYVLLLFTAGDVLMLGLTHYMAGVYRRAVWDDFNAAAIKWQPVEKVPYAELINRFGKQNQVSPQLIAAVIQAESSYHPRAVSPAGAHGLMQVIPATWQYVNNRIALCSGRHSGPCSSACYFQPDLNIGIGTAYLGELIMRYKGNVAWAVAAYNAGPGAVDQYEGIPPYSETQDYVKRVIDNWYEQQGIPKPVYDLPARRWDQARRAAWLLFGTLIVGLLLLVRQMNRRYGSWRWR